jgi:AcrR family transcriptional regulator/DNA-binding MarR family transcriptional regulator
VQEVERTRILEAMAAAMSARGADGGSVTVEEVIERTGISSEAFHEEFSDREACLLAAFELAVKRARKPTLAAYEAEPRWLDAIKAGLAALLRFLEDEPTLGRLLIVYSMSGGEQLLRRRVEVLGALADVVDRGRQEGPADRPQLAAVIGEGVVGAVIAVLQNRLLSSEQGPVIELFGSLVSIIVLPYLGVGAARRELARPAPPVRSAPTGVGSQDAGSAGDAASIRLTYRTARVLGAIADYPGASNREIADRVGIVDQGQISKLLGRLQVAALIAKIGDARTTRGAPNSWRVTERGERLLGRIRGRDLPA